MKKIFSIKCSKYNQRHNIFIISSNEHGIYELPHELLNDVRLRILGN